MRFGAMLGVAGLLAGAAGPAAADVQADCARTVLAYADAWDHKQAAAFGALFTDDATLDIGTGPVKGRAAIDAMFAKSNAGPTMRHLMTNVLITPTGGSGARGQSYLQLFAGPPSAGGAPVEVSGFTLVGEYQDVFRIDGSGCRIAERRLVPVFRRARPPGPSPAAAAPLPPRP